MMSFVNVTLKIPYVTKWGESLAVVGSCAALGNWDPVSARKMTYDAGLQFWETTFPASDTHVVEYKYFVRDELGNVRAWDSGENRRIELSMLHFGPTEIRDHWRGAIGPVDWLFGRSSAFTDAILARPNPRLSPTFATSACEGQVFVRVLLSQQLLRTQKLFLTGSTPELGEWDPKHAIEMNDFAYPELITEVPVLLSHFPFEYKFFVRDETRASLLWESGPNRICGVDKGHIPARIVIREGRFRESVIPQRMAGVAVPVFSLRSQQSLGCGEFRDLAALADWAKSTGLRVVQLLPINDTRVTDTWRDSYPYSSLSVFALHPMYINIAALDRTGAFKAELQREWQRLNGESVDYEETLRVKMALLRKLFQKDTRTHFLASEEFRKFFTANKDWLVPYAVFLCLKERYGSANFQTWPKYRTVTVPEVESLAADEADFGDVSFHYFVQYHLASQLSVAVQHANKQGVTLKGDLPIGVDSLSVDTWISPELFRIGKQTGAPPDAFSTTGQNWGFPTYDWAAMKKENFRWWRRRLECMAQYFGAYRIDHVLGFFRIWEIPAEGVSGLLGRFVPVEPVWRSEFSSKGLWDLDRLTKPYVHLGLLAHLFSTDQLSAVINKYFNEPSKWVYEFKPEYSTEKKIFAVENESKETRAKLAVLLANVLLLRDESNPDAFHFRIDAPKTSSFNELEGWQKRALYDLYIDYFYRRQDHLWAHSALDKLPMMQSTTRAFRGMLVCGEDLGMVPACVQGVLDALSILGLRIQRMPKDETLPFDDARHYPLLSVATPSVHDTSTIRGWWEEDRSLTQRFYNEALNCPGEAPHFAEPHIVEKIIQQHLSCESMLAIFPLQDLFAIEEKLRVKDPSSERINIPAVKHHYWKYRMHVPLEDLQTKYKDWSDRIKRLVQSSGRLV